MITEPIPTPAELLDPPDLGEDPPGYVINRYNYRTAEWCYYADEQSIRRLWGEISWFVDVLDLMDTEAITWIQCRRDGREYQFIRNRRPRTLSTIKEPYTPPESLQGETDR